jgi:uncharacterized protein (TIGR00730 family)
VGGEPHRFDRRLPETVSGTSSFVHRPARMGAVSDICVFCGSSTGNDPSYRAAADELGTRMAQGGHRLVYGGGHVGLMGVVADAVLRHDGHVTGVMTEQLVTEEVAHAGLTVLEVTLTMHERKSRMAALSDAVIVLPGGYGTYEEAFEILTWNQLGIIHKPIVFCDVAEFFSPLFQLIDRTIEGGFVHDGHRVLAQRATTPAEALERALSSAPPHVRKWVDGGP